MRFLSVFSSAALLAFPGWAAEPRQFITTGSGVRLRATGDTKGAEVAKLPIGTVLRELEAPGPSVTIDGKNGVWEHVEATTPGAPRGFIFTSVLAAFEPGHECDAALSLWTDRGTQTTLSFSERTDLCNAMDRLWQCPNNRATAAALALARIQCLKSALALIPPGSRNQPYRGFVTERAKSIVFSEPAAQWFAETTLLWATADSFKDTPSGDALAWEAASTYLPGECEGILACSVNVTTMTSGAYLRRFPTGEHAAEAMSAYTALRLTGDAIAQHSMMETDDVKDAVKALDEALVLLKSAAAGTERNAALEALRGTRAALQKAYPKVVKH